MSEQTFTVILDPELIEQYFGAEKADTQGFMEEMQRRATAQGIELPPEVFGALAGIITKHMKQNLTLH